MIEVSEVGKEGYEICRSVARWYAEFSGELKAIMRRGFRFGILQKLWNDIRPKVLNLGAALLQR